MAFRVRSSKFRHVFGSAAKKEHCYECIKITKNAHDSNFCAVNPLFVAVVIESAGGGSFVVLPVDKTGRVDINTPKVCGHSGPVLDIKWNPFNDHVIASSSDDATIKLWQIPDGGLQENLTEWVVDLHGHQRRVSYIEWHPTAENILLSAGYDFNCILWNTETAEPINIISVHTDTIFCIAWNRDGSLFATTSKDKMLRVISPRDGNVISEGQSHMGSKASKVVFVGDKNRLFTTGFSRTSEREYSIWDYKNLSKPLRHDTIDSSSGVLFPYFDYDTNIVYVAGKGDGNIRYFEIVDDSPYIHYLNQYQSGLPQRGLGYMPKRGIDPSKCEIFRFYKLHTVKTLVEPVAMIVPRKSEMFQEDLYPPTASLCPSLTADEWISGQNREPILMSLKDGQIISSPKSKMGKAVQRKKTCDAARMPKNTTRPPKTGPKTGKAIHRGNVQQLRRHFSNKDGIITNTPTITTYKAVKRGAVNSSVPGTPNKRPTEAKTANKPAPTLVEKTPASVKNIAKLSSQESMENNYNPAHGDGVDVSDRIGMFENKKTITVSSASHNTTRVNNAQQQMAVSKKVWSTSVSGVTSERQQQQQMTNGAPQTDPEPVLSPAAGTRHSRRPPVTGTAHSPLSSPISSPIPTSKTTFSSPSSKAFTLQSDSAQPRSAVSHRRAHTIQPGQQPPPAFATFHTTDSGSVSVNDYVPADDVFSGRVKGLRLNRNASASPESTDTSWYRTKVSQTSSEGMFVTPPMSPIARNLPSLHITESTPESTLNRTSGSSSTVDYSTLDKSSLAWNENPLFDDASNAGSVWSEAELKSRENTRKKQHKSSTEIHLSSSSRETTPQREPIRRSESLGRGVDTSALDDILQDFETTAGSMDRSTHHTHRSDKYIDRNTKTESSNYVYKKDTLESDSRKTKKSTGRSKSLNIENGAKNDNASIKDILHAQTIFENSPDWILDDEDAPDDTLIYPSKMRASLRSKKTKKEKGFERSGVGRHSMKETSSSARATPERSMSLKQTRSWRSAEPEIQPANQPRSVHTAQSSHHHQTVVSSSSQMQTSTQENGTNNINHKRNRRRIVRRLPGNHSSSDDETEENNNFKSKAAVTLKGGSGGGIDSTTQALVFRTSQSSDSPRPLSFSDQSPTSPFDQFATLYDNYPHPHPRHPSSQRDNHNASADSQNKKDGRNHHRRHTTDVQTENNLHVKKVWSPRTPTSPEPLTTENGLNMPDTDPELRKAYFRQLEEIKSLKEQIAYKDKRIRQLEEEVKLLRVGGGAADESTC